MQNLSYMPVSNPLQTHLHPRALLGTRGKSGDKREWVYCRATATVATGLILKPQDFTSVDDVNGNAAAVNALGRTWAIRQVITPESSPSWTPGILAGSWGIVDDGTNEGLVFQVETNDASSLYLKSALSATLGGSSDDDITLMNGDVDASSNHLEPANPCLVIPVPASEFRGMVIGVSQVAVTDEYYFWALTKGLGFVYTGANSSSGGKIYSGDDTPGYGVLGGADLEDDALGTYIGEVMHDGTLSMSTGAADKLVVADINIR